MIFGIGTDIVEIERIAKIYAKFHNSFAERILSQGELNEFNNLAGGQISFLAKRFATKEAFVKALGTGFINKIDFASFGTKHDSLGKPEASYSPEIQRILDENGINNIHISVSDEKKYALAVVILEKNFS